jgi:hypothetical protein
MLFKAVAGDGAAEEAVLAHEMDKKLVRTRSASKHARLTLFVHGH